MQHGIIIIICYYYYHRRYKSDNDSNVVCSSSDLIYNGDGLWTMMFSDDIDQVKESVGRWGFALEKRRMTVEESQNMSLEGEDEGR